MAAVMTGRLGLRIGITQRRLPATATSFTRDALDADWSTWFRTHWPGVAYVPVPNFEQPEEALAYVAVWGLNGFVFSGGEDPGSSPARDAVEAALLDHAVRHRLPLLGICRGMQVLHRYSGGALAEQPGHLGMMHGVQANGGLVQVNSWHRLTITELALGWRALAVAEDGTIEAMQHLNLPLLGLMWHPERVRGERDPSCAWIDSLFGLAPR